MMAVKIPPAVTREELEAAFPWVCYLPPEATSQFLAIIESYREAARIYSRKRRLAGLCSSILPTSSSSRPRSIDAGSASHGGSITAPAGERACQQPQR